MRARARDDRWVIVLAGGSGTRLASLTKDGSGAVVPKQYCSLRGGRSLLGDALARASLLARPDRTLVVVAQEHECHWRREFAGRPQLQVVVQPENRGTAAGVLLPLLTILRSDPDPLVTLLPADHFVADERGLARSLHKAQRDARAAPSQTILLGIEPDAAETGYGWILPASRRGADGERTAREGALPIRAFVEKPDAATATRLWADGAVWNSFLIVAKAHALRALYQRALPGLLHAFESSPLGPAAELAKLYRAIDSRDFSFDLLQGAGPRLAVRIVPRCGWTDLGTPERVRQCLAVGAGAVTKGRVGPSSAPVDLAMSASHGAPN